jgi:hypothetical protein
MSTTIAKNTTFYRPEMRANTTKELVDEAWKKKSEEVKIAYIADGLTHECIQLAEVLRWAWKNTLELYFKGKIIHVDKLYGVMTSVIDWTIEVTGEAIKFADFVRSQRFDVDRYDDLLKALTDIRGIKSEIESQWPRTDEKVIEESKANWHRELVRTL